VLAAAPGAAHDLPLARPEYAAVGEALGS